jgi:hypothetical protein
MTLLTWGFLVRFGQVGLESCLTLIIGVVIAGIFRRMLGPAGTRRLFGRGVRGLASGWFAGMLLPVCSLGVIPVARELRRSGVPGGTVLAFVLAAPLLNPISFLYGLSLAEPIVILSYAGASLILSTAAGFLWDRLFASADAREQDQEVARQADLAPVPGEGPRRILAVILSAARELAGRDLLFYGIGLTGSALLAAAIPYGALQHTMQHSDKLSPIYMVLIAVPLYTGPLTGMMKIGLMFDHGNSVGAAFLLFILGIGTSLGTLAWLGTDFGWRRIVPWFLTYVSIAVGLAYLAEPLLYDNRKEEANHTHAFDDYTAPFPRNHVPSDIIAEVRGKLADKFGPLERPPLYALGGLILVGVITRRLDRHGAVERWLTASPPLPTTNQDRPWWNRSVPGPVLGAITLMGLIGMSVIGAYIYYPDRSRCFDEMASVRADAFSATNSKRPEESIRYLERWDLLVRKLEVGEYLRSLGVTAEQTDSAAELREALEAVRDLLLAGKVEEARKIILSDVEEAFQAVKAAYPRPPQPLIRD